MSISGFDDKFLFYGFLPKKENELIKVLKLIKDLNYSLVFFIPGIKINFYLNFFKEFFLDRDILIAREITKIHETFYRNSVKLIKPFKVKLKGELTVVISKKYNNNNIISDEDIKKQSIKYLKKYSLKDAVELVSKKEKVSRKKVYEICLKIKNDKKNI
jgi:16S rRNA (cytidine1402-2'-O)-methyltransferase